MSEIFHKQILPDELCLKLVQLPKVRDEERVREEAAKLEQQGSQRQFNSFEKSIQTKGHTNSLSKKNLTNTTPK